VTAKGMDDTRRLKEEFGDDLVFWGGIDTQRLLPSGTPEEVRSDVRRRILDMATGGGSVLNSVHNIQGGVSSREYHRCVRRGICFRNVPSIR